MFPAIIQAVFFICIATHSAAQHGALLNSAIQTLFSLCRAFLVELLPVLLLGLTDEASSIRDATMSRLSEIGLRHAAMQASVQC